MKSPLLSICTILLLFLVIGCHKGNDDLDQDIKDGFSLVINDSITYNSSHIDFYDLSAHLIYLKEGYRFSFTDGGTFSILIDNAVIYSGQMHPMYSSHFPVGPYIPCAPTLFNDYVIPIGFNHYADNEGDPNVDPREDTRIIEALKISNQCKEGLSSEILSISRLVDRVEISMRLTNMDSENLLILDPNKMGIELFHYFTNGLIVYQASNSSYTHNLTSEKPVPWDQWKSEWFSVIGAYESKTVTLVYSDFDVFPSGSYTVWFNYPGLSYQVDQQDLQQPNGRIWLGQLHSTKVVNL